MFSVRLIWRGQQGPLCILLLWVGTMYIDLFWSGQIRLFGYERVFLLLYKVTDTPVQIQGDEVGFLNGQSIFLECWMLNHFYIFFWILNHLECLCSKINSRNFSLSLQRLKKIAYLLILPGYFFIPLAVKLQTQFTASLLSNKFPWATLHLLFSSHQYT